MTPPMNYMGRSPNGNGTRRVEFSGLSTIDSEAPEESAAPHWDTETDHLLSYFLGDPTAHSHPSHASAYQDFSSVPHSSSMDMNPPLGMNASYGPGSSRTSSNSTLTEAAEPPQPRTPAMQFYHPSSHSQQQHHHSQTMSYARQTAENIAAAQAHGQMISSSSSSSLSSMAAALMSGGPVLHHQIHHCAQPNTTSTAPKQNSDSPPGHGDDSPLSPAAMIGTGHENLMLPPPSRRHSRDRQQIPPTGAPPGASPQVSAAAVSQAAANPPNSNMVMYPGQPHPDHQQHQQQQQYHGSQEGHLEWLKQLNARAKAANHHSPAPATATAIMPPPSGTTMVAMHQQPTVVAQHPAMAATIPPGTHIFHAGTYPSAAAAAAAVAQNPMLYQAAFNHKFHMAAQSQGESEEKRARRLERNRESARKSRRRKKERLATLEAQVDRLHTHIEDERRKQVNAMCSTLKKVRVDEMSKLYSDYKDNLELLNVTDEGRQRLAAILHCTSGGSQIAQASVEFQYNVLKQLLLPRYQKFLLWLTLHEECFYTAGKDEYTKKDGKQVLRVSSGRVSSKQIGDELTNGWKTEKPDGKKKSKADTPDIGERCNPTSRCLDAPRMWPLLCYELSISVDQEERLMQSIKRLQQMENLANNRSQLAAATQLATSLTEAITSQCRIALAREDRSVLQTLTPSQTVKMHEWIAANQERCNRFISERRPAAEKCYPVFKETSLIEFCKRLEEVLRISKKE